MAPTPQNMDQTDWRITPLVLPPTGVDSNFENPESRAPMAIVVSACMLGLSVTSMAGRLYSRKFILNMMGWDDYIALAGSIFVAEYTIYSIVLFSQPGMGPHMWDIPGIVFLDDKFGLKLLFTEIMYCPSAYLVKLSIFLLYWRVFHTGVGRIKYFIYGGMYGSGVLYLALTILSFAFCTKSTSLVDGGDCHTKGSYVTWALATVNLLTDLYLLAIPPFIITRLNISTQKKWAIYLVFLFSLAATTASVASIYYRAYISKHSTDFSWNIIPAAVATISELNLGVVCCSLPAMNVFIHRNRYQNRRNTGYRTPSRTAGWSLGTLTSRVLGGEHRSLGLRSNDGHTQSSSHIGGDRDIVKLIDISQFSEPIGPTDLSLEDASTFSTAPSTQPHPV